MDLLLLNSITKLSHNGYESMNYNLVYYTAKETAFQIIKNKEIWMRKNYLMNDSEEFIYGEKIVREIINNPLKERLKAVLTDLNITEDYFVRSFEDTLSKIKEQSYILCMTKEDTREKKDGRLSMWRSYGAETGVAFVFNTKVLLDIFATITGEETKDVYQPLRLLFPIIYGEQKIIERDIDGILEQVLKYDEEYIKNDINNGVLNQIILNLYFAMMIQKHPGFIEENEIRFWYNPLNETGTNYGMKKIQIEDKALNSIDQRVAVIKLDEIAKDIEFSWSTLIDTIIIGPMQEEKGRALREVLFDKIREQDEKFSIAKIVLSSIPYRASLK